MMKQIPNIPRLILFFLLMHLGTALPAQPALPVWKNNKAAPSDWLIDAGAQKAGVYSSPDQKDLILDNGFITRSFRLAPNVACIDFTNKTNGQQLLRAVMPEARVTINGKPYQVGGLYGQKEKGLTLI